MTAPQKLTITQGTTGPLRRVLINYTYGGSMEEPCWTLAIFLTVLRGGVASQPPYTSVPVGCGAFAAAQVLPAGRCSAAAPRAAAAPLLPRRLRWRPSQPGSRAPPAAVGPPCRSASPDRATLPCFRAALLRRLRGSRRAVLPARVPRSGPVA